MIPDSKFEPVTVQFNKLLVLNPAYYSEKDFQESEYKSLVDYLVAIGKYTKEQARFIANDRVKPN